MSYFSGISSYYYNTRLFIRRSYLKLVKRKINRRAFINRIYLRSLIHNVHLFRRVLFSAVSDDCLLSANLYMLPMVLCGYFQAYMPKAFSFTYKIRGAIRLLGIFIACVWFGVYWLHYVLFFYRKCRTLNLFKASSVYKNDKCGRKLLKKKTGGRFFRHFLKKIKALPPFEVALRSARKKKRKRRRNYGMFGLERKSICIIRYKATRTNLYLTVSDKRGNVYISRSTGSLGFKNRWERQYPGTFSKLLDVCLRFVKKHRLATHSVCYATSYNTPYHHSLVYKARTIGLDPVRVVLQPIRVHGQPLRQARPKRL